MIYWSLESPLPPLWERLLGLKNGVIDPPHHPPLFCFSLSFLLLLSPAIKLTGTWVDNRKRNGRTLTAPLGGIARGTYFVALVIMLMILSRGWSRVRPIKTNNPKIKQKCCTTTTEPFPGAESHFAERRIPGLDNRLDSTWIP